MKLIDLALKDLTRFFRSAMGVIFMFGIPLLVTGMFYFMFGNIARQGDFTLPQIKVVVANLDRGGPKLQMNTRNVPGGIKAKTMGELIVGVLQSDDLKDLLAVTLLHDNANPRSDTTAAHLAAEARAAVDRQEAQVAIIIPPDFSRQFADINGQATIQFYQDPTLTIGPGIVKSLLNQFMDALSGIKIAVNVTMDNVDAAGTSQIGQVVQDYLQNSQAQNEDPASVLLEVRAPTNHQDQAAEQSRNALLSIITPIMGGMMIFYAFYTGTAMAQSILREEEERTLPRLFTTPTPQAVILSGKFLSVFLTVLVQVVVLLIAARLIFGIRWGAVLLVGITAFGIVVLASSFGIFINSFLKTTRQGGVIFGGVLTMSGMIGMIGIFAMGSPSGQKLANSVSLLAPQGWAVRGLLQSMDARPLGDVLITLLVMLLWSAVFFIVGVLRFNRRYA